MAPRRASARARALLLLIAAAALAAAPLRAAALGVAAPPVAEGSAVAPTAAAGPVSSAIPGQGTLGPTQAPVVAEAPAAGMSAWVAAGSDATATGVQQFGIWTIGRLVQILVAVFLLVLVCFFMIVSSRQMANTWEQEQQSEEWRPFAKAGRNYATARPVSDRDDNPWREGSGLVVPKIGGYSPGAPPMPALVSSQARTPPEEWDKLPSWA